MKFSTSIGILVNMTLVWEGNFVSQIKSSFLPYKIMENLIATPTGKSVWKPRQKKSYLPCGKVEQ